MNASAGDEIVLIAHLPRVGITDESVRFLDGDLWRMPFEFFDALTMGAFSDHRAAYEAAQPVFYRIVVRRRLPNIVALDPAATSSSSMQLRMPFQAWALLPQLGLEIVVIFHAVAVTPAWQSLLLQMPDAALPPPSWSMTFAIADEGFGFAHGDRVSRIASVQGVADVEYLINEGFPRTVFDSATLQAASAWAQRLSDESTIDAALWPALDALGDCASPMLSPADRTTLATMALESLLLTEARSGLSATLAQRLANLLSRDEPERRLNRELARSLYKTRSASVHGEEPPILPPGSPAAEGPWWLASAITALDQLASSTSTPVAELLPRLDEQAVGAVPLKGPGVQEQAHGWLRQRTSVVATSASRLASPEDAWLMWAPLPGLLNHQPLALDDEGRRLLLSLSGDELLQLEERDIARDFAGSLRQVADEIAALCLLIPAHDDDETADAIAQLQRERDLAVMALRLAGFHEFCDPALAGPVVMRRLVRLRQPSVLRQSVWQAVLQKEARAAAVTVQQSDGPLITAAWTLLDRYLAAGGHPELDHARSLYVRAFDRDFNTRHACASLHFAATESLLGRFRAPDEPTSLEVLVERLLGTQNGSAAWFAREGRSLRNAVAHGRAQDGVADEALDALSEVAGAAWRRAAELWVDAPEAPMRPSKRLMRALASG